MFFGVSTVLGDEFRLYLRLFTERHIWRQPSRNDVDSSPKTTLETTLETVFTTNSVLSKNVTNNVTKNVDPPMSDEYVAPFKKSDVDSSPKDVFTRLRDQW